MVTPQATHISGALWVLDVSMHIHTVVENSDHNDFGFRACPVKDDMAVLAILFVSGLYVFRVAAYMRLSSKQLEGVIKLLEVFIALQLSPLFRGKSGNFKNVFSGSGGEQKLAHQGASLSSSAIRLSSE